MRLLLEFDRFPKERKLIGQMLMAYGEFEFATANILGYAINDKDQAARIFFRVHGEAARLDVSDAILRQYFNKQNLGGQWGNTIGALRYCKNVRNQYAHCNWTDGNGREPLTFCNMDVDAASPEGELMLTMHPVDSALISRQHAYFEYTNDWLFFMNCQVRRLDGQECPNPPAPKSIPQPPLSNRPKKPPGSPGACTTPKERPEGS